MEEWGERKSKSLCRRRENKEKNQNKKRDGELEGGGGEMFGAGPPHPPHPPKFRIVRRSFFQIVFIHSFIFFLYLSMSLGLWFSI